MNWEDKENKKFLQAILALETQDEAKRFLRDLLTQNEIEEFAKRLQAAEMLSAGVHYSAIEEKTGFSSTTVARVSKWLRKGEGGYKFMLKRLEHQHPVQSRRGLS